MTTQTLSLRTKQYLALHGAFFLLSLSGVFSKLAAQSDKLISWRFISFYVVSILIQMFFMYQWQQFLKFIPLSIAYTNRAINLIWGMGWGWLIFGEMIRPAMIIGSLLVILGIAIMSRDEI